MSSAIFFKFKSQRDPQRIAFDGTHLSVFELKREIIRVSQLGDGSDFDLGIYHEDSNEEYDDDTAIIPRSTTVIARRLPPSKPGQGRAARYVSGRMPTTAKNSHRTEPALSSARNKQGTSTSSGASAMEKAQTEEERIAAMLQMGADQWEEQKQHMASAAPVYRPGGMKGKPVNVPDHPPPPEYVCYRCGVKGHWIQACPTNNDPKFDGRPRVVRTVGIPRSFLQQVEKPATSSEEGLTDEARQPSSRWVDSEGNAVAAIPDVASWEQFQAKAQASAKQQDVFASGSKELQDRGLECPIDRRLFVDPMKTPCCHKTYCHECIETALINSDLVCPGCSTEGVLLDNLVPDDDTTARIKAYEDEKKAEKKVTEKPDGATTPDATATARKSKSPTPSASGTAPDRTSSASPKPSQSDNKKKRPASDELRNDRRPDAPTPTLSVATVMAKTTSSTGSTGTPNPTQQQKQTPQPPSGFDQAFFEQMNAMAGGGGQNGLPNNNSMNAGNMPFPMGMNMGGGNMPNMMAMMNPMMGMQMQGGWNGGMPMPGMMGGMMPNMGMGMPGMPPMPPMPQQWAAMNGFQGMRNNNANGDSWGPGPNNNNNNGMMFPGGGQFPQKQHQQHHHPQHQHQQSQPIIFPPTGPGQKAIINMNMGTGVFPNQQQSGNDDSPYMRQPVNPHRHLGRQRKVRPTDYREL